jgi:hypothetical protein
MVSQHTDDFNHMGFLEDQQQSGITLLSILWQEIRKKVGEM